MILAGHDLDRIMTVMEEAFDPQWGEAWNRRQVSDSLLLPTTYYRLLDENSQAPVQSGEAAGFYLSRYAPGEEELLLLAVRPSLRGKGIGGALLRLLAADAAGRGAERLFLEMRANNPAESLYLQHGFTPIGRRRDYYRLADASHIDAITFTRSL